MKEVCEALVLMLPFIILVILSINEASNERKN